MTITAAEGPAVSGSLAHPRHRRRLPIVVAAVVGVAGVVYRLIMVLAHVPPSNSDEATMGLAALHVQTGRGYPIFFYGQHYMGTLEAYLAAPLLAFTGPSVLAMRLPNLLFYAAFLVLMWHLTRRLYTPWLATFTVALLALGSYRMLQNQLIAGGGYPEIAPAGALLVLLAINLAARPRTAGFAIWGFVAGLMLWDDWLIMPYVAAAGALLLVPDRRTLRGRPGLALGLGMLVGAGPLIVYNATAPLRDNSLSVFLGLNGGADASWADRLYGGMLFGLPMGTGLCAPGRCAPWQLWWGLVWPILLVAAGLLAWRALRGATEKAERVRQAGRLALVFAAAVSLLTYVRSSAAGITPVESARYLSCLLISTPAVLWPLWSALAGLERRHRVLRAGAAAVLAGLLATMLAATAAIIAEAPEISARADKQRQLIAALDRLGVTRFYSDYWTCNNITFASKERIVCAVIGDSLHAGFDRYRPYRAEVARAHRQTYVFDAGLPINAAVAAHLRGTGVPVTVTTAGGYDIYQPASRVALPLP